jgi:hypothetical protein
MEEKKNETNTLKFWFELELEHQEGGTYRVRSRDSREFETSWSPLDAKPFLDFAACLKKAAEEGESLDANQHQAEDLYRLLFQGQVGDHWKELKGAAGGDTVLLKWKTNTLKEVPLEALYDPAKGYLGLSKQVLPVRTVPVQKAWEPWNVEGAVRVLGVAPHHEAELGRLKVALGQSLRQGMVEWLEPVVGVGTRQTSLMSRLASVRGDAHVLCFVGHLDWVNGKPCLRLAEDEGETSWLQVEDLAMALESRFDRQLRLVVLQACEGADPKVLASAAELLIQKGASAVVAHLWKTRTDVAGQCTSAMLWALTQGALEQGNVVASLNHARQMVWMSQKPAHGVETFSAVLYLRGQQPHLFDFTERKPPVPVQEDPGVEPALEQLLKKPFSLVLGDVWHGERMLHARLEAKLRKELPPELRGAAPEPPEGTQPEFPTSMLAQRYLLHTSSRDKLNTNFQKTYQGKVQALRGALAGPAAGPLADQQDQDVLSLMAGLAQRLSPGIHVTLLRLPLLELALTRYQPTRTIYMVEPPRSPEDEASVTVFTPGNDWEPLSTLPDSLDLEREFLVLRLHRGYHPGGTLTDPLLTEDDYLLQSPGLRDVLGGVADTCLAQLWGRPALLLGVSLLAWHHRKLLHTLFPSNTLKPASVVLLEPGGPETQIWKKGSGVPGKVGLKALERNLEELTALLAPEAPGGNP